MTTATMQETAKVTLEDSLVSIINQVTTTVSDGVGFLSSEIPEVISQLLMFELIWSIAMIVVHLSLAIGMFKLSVFLYKRSKSKLENPEGRWSSDDHGLTITITYSVLALILILSLLRMIESLRVILLVIVAPKVYLIQYAADLIK
jgi:hypothetical protein